MMGKEIRVWYVIKPVFRSFFVEPSEFEGLTAAEIEADLNERAKNVACDNVEVELDNCSDTTSHIMTTLEIQRAADEEMNNE